MIWAQTTVSAQDVEAEYMRAIIYGRYSTDKQDMSIEVQVSRCKEYAEYKSFAVVDVIQDLAVSGGTNKGRLGFMNLLSRVEQGECDLILTYDLTRLSREMVSLLALERFFNEYNCLLFTVEGQIDTSTVEGFMSFAMRAFLGEMERRTVKLRTKRAMEHLRANGKVFNHPPYGWTRVEDRLDEVPEEQGTIRLVNDLYRQGLALSDIQRILRVRKIKTRNGRDWDHKQVRRLIAGYEQTRKVHTSELGKATRAFIEAVA